MSFKRLKFKVNKKSAFTGLFIIKNNSRNRFNHKIVYIPQEAHNPTIFDQFMKWEAFENFGASLTVANFVYYVDSFWSNFWLKLNELINCII